MSSPPAGSGIYESDRALREYLLFHYGDARQILPWPVDLGDGALEYPTRCARLALEHWGEHRAEPPERALDLGCAVGRTTFELARGAREVVGVDLSRSFVDAATTLARDGALSFRYPVRGEITETATARPPAGVDRSRVRFEVGDAADLAPRLGDFDLVVMANLIDRLPDPRRCLRGLRDRIRPGGVVLVSSPYTWLAEFTPRAEWLGADEREPEPASAIGAALGDAFALVSRHDLPFVIREHERKYQWSMAEATLWRRLERSR